MSASSALGTIEQPAPPARRGAKALLALVGIAATSFAIFGMLALPGEEHVEIAAPDSRAVSTLVFPVKSYERLIAPKEGEFRLPVAAVPVGNELVVLDTGLDRVLKLDKTRKVAATYDVAQNPGLTLHQAMALTTDGTRLYIANSLSSEVLVLDAATGKLERTIRVTSGAGEKPARLTGLALLPDDRLAVSDGDNHRVIVLDANGAVVGRFGAGKRATGKDGFNAPAALTADREGSLYVVDTLNSRVVKLARDGSYAAEFGTRGTTIGKLARPKGVAVDDKGRVFVSDAITAAVSVYASDGAFLGIIGREDDEDPTSPGMFRAPAQLWLVDDTLYVADRIAGVVIFKLEEGPLHPPQPSTGPFGSH